MRQRGRVHESGQVWSTRRATGNCIVAQCGEHEGQCPALTATMHSDPKASTSVRRPDASRIGVHGGSQGGALTLVLAALRNDAITCGAAGAPYLTGFMDAASLTHSNPYEEINDYLREYPEREAQVRATTEYFDCINLADRITCPMRVTIGMGDDVCPPETAYALVNAMINTQAELQTYPRCAHDAGSYWDAAKVRAFLAEHLRPAGGAR